MSTAVRKPIGYLIIGLVLALGFSIVYLGSGQAQLEAQAIQPAGPSGQGLASVEQLGQTFNRIAKMVSPSVVHVSTGKTIKSRFGPDRFHKSLPGRRFGPFFELFPELNERPSYQQGLGSGVVIHPDGYILTNYHVVKDADDVTVELTDGRRFSPVWIHTDPPTDLAVIKIDASGLPALSFADSEKLKVGDWVLAVGNPFGLDSTVTQGIISYLGRSRGVNISPYSNYIQTDAAINPGNSGGPLVDLRGRIIGINTFIVSKTQSYAGLGFAIPADIAKFVAEHLRESKKVTRSYLGVQIQELKLPLAKSFGLDSTQGAVLTEVGANTPAAKAGLEAGDVILQFDGRDVHDSNHLQMLVAQVKPGTTVKVVLWRDNARKEFSVKLEKMPEDYFDKAYSQLRQPSEEPGQAKIGKLGITVATLGQQLAKKYDHQGRKGALVVSVEPDGEAARVGIGKGDLITEVQNEKVTSAEQLIKLLNKHSLDQGVRVRIHWSRGGSAYKFIQIP